MRAAGAAQLHPHPARGLGQPGGDPGPGRPADRQCRGLLGRQPAQRGGPGLTAKGRHEALLLARRLLARHPRAARGDRQALRAAAAEFAEGEQHKPRVPGDQPQGQGADPGARRRQRADRVPGHRLVAGADLPAGEAAAGGRRAAGAGAGGHGLCGRHAPRPGLRRMFRPMRFTRSRPTRRVKAQGREMFEKGMRLLDGRWRARSGSWAFSGTPTRRCSMSSSGPGGSAIDLPANCAAHKARMRRGRRCGARWSRKAWRAERRAGLDACRRGIDTHRSARILASVGYSSVAEFGAVMPKRGWPVPIPVTPAGRSVSTWSRLVSCQILRDRGLMT